MSKYPNLRCIQNIIDVFSLNDIIQPNLSFKKIKFN